MITDLEQARFFANVFDLDEKQLGIKDNPFFINDARGKHAKFSRHYSEMDALRQASKQHSWTRATISAVARAGVGSGFAFTKHPVFGKNISDQEKKDAESILEPVYDFFYGINNDWSYIQNVHTLASKMYYSFVSFAYYGQLAWEILRDKKGAAIGFDTLPGIVYPNVDKHGKFLKPAYLFRSWNSQDVVEYNSPLDLIYITWPGMEFNIAGNTEYESLTRTAIPSDLYAAYAYKSHFENHNAPYNGVWVVDPATQDEDYKKFLSLLMHRYTGVKNFGRNPLVIRGQVEFKENRSRSNDDAPYLEGRKYVQEEISAVSGVASAKIGLAANATRTNYRELRKDFHENTLRPIFGMIEDGIYSQLFVREFGLKKFMLQFNNPELSTPLEQSTIITRYIQNGVLSPNEGRLELGRSERTDEQGGEFYIPANIMPSDQTDQSLSVNEDNPNSQDRSRNMLRPPEEQRSKQPVENQIAPDLIKQELQDWKNFSVRIAKGKRSDRSFECKYISSDIQSDINTILLEIKNDEQEIRRLFDSLISQFVM